MERWRAAAATAAWLVGFAGAGWFLWGLGRHPWLVVDWADPLAWLASADLEAVLAAAARLTGLALVVWVLGSTLVYSVVRLSGIRPGSLEWLSIRPIRRAVDAMVAGSLVLSSMTPALAGIDPSPPPPATAEVAGQQAVSVDPSYVPVPAGSGTPPGPSPAPEPPRQEVADRGEVEVVVAGGDNLWKLAERRLADVTGRQVSDAEVAPYWRQIVEVNRPRLRSGDPDLIFPGEEVVLPSPES